MATLIDSSVPIAAERGQLDLGDALAQRGDEPVAIAAITASELLHGVHRARTDDQRARREAYVERPLEALGIVPSDLIVARAHARLWAHLAEQGALVGANDLAIAATAVAHGYAVATRDQRSFPRIPGLTTVLW